MVVNYGHDISLVSWPMLNDCHENVVFVLIKQMFLRIFSFELVYV